MPVTSPWPPGTLVSQLTAHSLCKTLKRPRPGYPGSTLLRHLRGHIQGPGHTAKERPRHIITHTRSPGGHYGRQGTGWRTGAVSKGTACPGDTQHHRATPHRPPSPRHSRLNGSRITTQQTPTTATGGAAAAKDPTTTGPTTTPGPASAATIKEASHPRGTANPPPAIARGPVRAATAARR